jgi:molybdopterin converting factor subunit 1
MKLAVQLFARARDLAGAGQITVELPAQATVRDLRKQLGKTCPALDSLLPHCALAVDNEYAGDSAVLSSTSEVALLPPVSGG